MVYLASRHTTGLEKFKIVDVESHKYDVLEGKGILFVVVEELGLGIIAGVSQVDGGAGDHISDGQRAEAAIADGALVHILVGAGPKKHTLAVLGRILDHYKEKNVETVTVSRIISADGKNI